MQRRWLCFVMFRHFGEAPPGCLRGPKVDNKGQLLEEPGQYTKLIHSDVGCGWYNLTTDHEEEAREQQIKDLRLEIARESGNG